jgi:hypothetical protein
MPQDGSTMLAEAPSLLLGRAQPRVAPPVPVRSDIATFREVATDIGISLMPWQEQCARYLTALAPDDRWLYREVGIVVARQNGKTTLLVPLIVQRLRAGQRIMHTAQDRALPREVFGLVADILSQDLTLFPQRNGRSTKPRFANGQEEIRLANGGMYSIVAPTRGGARGPSRDLVIIDELREMDTWDFIAASKPTLTASRNPQMIYLSNAGEDDSIVLNALRDRAGKDPALAYLEWSAAPDRPSDDRIGWAEANPALGNEVGEMGSVLETLEADYRTALLEGTLGLFETEHLCRWVNTLRQRLVDEHAWMLGKRDDLPAPRRVHMGISMDPSGTRAAAAIAWQDEQRQANVRLIYDVTGSPIDVAAFGADLKQTASQLGVSQVAFDPLTDAELAKFFKKPIPLSGQKWANASSLFANLVQGGRLLWTDADAVTDDLVWTARKDHDESGSFQAVRANDDRPIPAALAAIRAVSAAFGPPLSRPKVY